MTVTVHILNDWKRRRKRKRKRQRKRQRQRQRQDALGHANLLFLNFPVLNWVESFESPVEWSQWTLL